MEDKNKEYLVLRHLLMPDKGKCFFTTNNPDEPEEEKGLSAKGERWYEVVGYADTVNEAQSMCRNNYGGIPTQQEFDDWAKEKVRKRWENFDNQNNEE